MEKLKKVDNYQDFINLSPTSDATDIDEYSEILDYSLNNKDIQNIAVFGNYGAGKSSFLKTYFKDKNNYINITLGTYGKKTKDIGKRKMEEYHQTIEKSILQQLLYQTEQEKVPQSRFKRLTKYSKPKMFLNTSIFIMLLLICMFVFVPNFFNKFFEPFNSISETLKVLNFKIKSFTIYNNYILASFLYILICLFIVFIIYKICEFIKDNFYISKLKYKDAEIEINGKTESIFNKYLDEIIYFFQCSEYDIVIFEDIDRFNEALFIIEKLKELNYLLNTSSKITRKISFIYAIKDDFFEDITERTKFFDKTIPIIPVSSLSNSNEIIWEKFRKIYGDVENNMYYEIDKKFINNISVFVDDMRTINNIMADFVLFSDKFIDKDLDNRKLLAMIFYKNLYPQKYAKLLKGEGILPNVIQNKNNVVIELTKKLENDKKQLLDEIKEIRDENLLNILELKQVFIMNLANISNVQNNNLHLRFNNVECNISDFLNDTFDINKIKNERLTLKNSNYPYNDFDEEQIFEYFDGKENFIKRINNLSVNKNENIRNKQLEINEIENSIKKIKEMPIENLINKYGISLFSDNLNDLESFMLRRGLISSDYYDYITLFKEGNLTIQDMQFVKNVKKDNKMEFYSYRLENLSEIVNRLDIFDYSSKSILNYDLFNYIFDENNKVDIDIRNKILLQFENITEEEMNFIDGYLEKFDCSKNFVNSLLTKKTDIWKKCYLKRSENKNYIDSWVVIFLKNEKFLLNTDDDFINYIQTHENFYKVFSLLDEDSKKQLVKLNIKFNNINEECTKDFAEFILKNNLYEINSNMLELLLEKIINSSKKFLERFLSILEDQRLSYMKEYIYNNFEIYINNIYNKLDKQNNDEFVILNIINNDSITDEIKLKIITKESIKIKDLNEISTDYYDAVLNNNLFEYNWNNIICIYNYEEEISKQLADVINGINSIENIELLESQSNFLIDLINNDTVNLETLEKNLNLFDAKISNLEDIDFNYSFEKLELIINNDILEFNNDNFNYIKDKSVDLLALFINLNEEYYIGNIDTFDISNIENDLIKNSKLGDLIKVLLFENNLITCDKLEIDFLYELVINNKYNLRKEESSNLIFNSDISYDKKYHYLNKIMEEISMDQTKEYLCQVNAEFQSIGIGKNNFSVDFNQDLLEILKLFESKKIISSSNLTKTNRIMIYNRKR